MPIMLRITLTATLALLLLFTLLSAAAIAISSVQPPKPALAGFERCDYGGWCWFGIRPGVTTVREADQLLRDAGYERVKRRLYVASEASGFCNVRIHDQYEDFEIVEVIYLNCDDREVQAGDLPRIIGDPIGIGTYDTSPYGSSLYNPTPPYFIFDNAAIVMINRPYNLDFLLGEIDFILVTSVSHTIVAPWENFNDYNFCRSEPTTAGCP